MKSFLAIIFLTTCFPLLHCGQWKTLPNKPKVFYQVSPVRLKKDLLPPDYDPLMAPAFNQTLRINISVSILHVAMLQVTEKALPVQLFVEISWSDFRLSRLYSSQKQLITRKGFVLEPKEEFGLQLLMSPPPPIWMPSVQMNSFTQIPLIQDLEQVVLVNETYVHYLTRVSNRLYCDYIAWQYPHERFNCSITFSIPNDSIQRVFLQWDQFRREKLHMNSFHIDYDTFQADQQCRPFQTDVRESKVDFNDDFIVFESCADVSVRLTRELGYFMLALYLPSGFCVQMALCNFLLPVGALNARMLCIFLPLACLILLYNSIPIGTGYTLLHAWLLLCQVFVLLCFPYLALAAMERAEQLVMRQNVPKAGCRPRKMAQALSRQSSGQVIPLPASLNVEREQELMANKPNDAGQPDQSDATAKPVKASLSSRLNRRIMSIFFWSSAGQPSARSSSRSPSSTPTQSPAQPSLQALRIQKEQEMVSFSTLRLDRQARVVMPALFYCCTMIYVLFVYSLDN